MARTKSTTKTAAGQIRGPNPANRSHNVTGSTVAAASVNEADSAFGYFRRSDQFADRRKNGTDAFIMLINSLLQELKLQPELCVRRGLLTDAHESANDIDAHLDRRNAIQHHGSHYRTVFGERKRRKPRVAVLLRTSRNLRQVQLSGFYFRKAKDEVRWESTGIPFYLLIQRLGRSAVKRCKLRVENNPLSAGLQDDLADFRGGGGGAGRCKSLHIGVQFCNQLSRLSPRISGRFDRKMHVANV